MGQRVVYREELSAVGETVRGDIKNAHDERALINGHCVVLNFPSRGCHGLELSWLRIAAGDRRHNRLQRLGSWFFRLRSVLVSAVGNRRILIEWKARDNPSNFDTVQRLALQ